MSTYNDASLIYYPSGYKSGKAYSLKPTDGSGDLDFTRASSATRVNADGLIEEASILNNDIVVNGNFTTNTNWDLGSATISGGLLNLLGGGGLSYALQTNTNLVIGKRYLATYTIVSISNAGSGVRVRVGNGGNGIYRTTTGTFTEIITCAGSLEIFLEGNSTNFIGSIDNVSVKEVITNNVPRIDFTGAGCAKLLLEPQRTNLIKNSANVGAGFVVGNITLVLNNAAAPNGLVEADKFYPTTSGNYRWFYQAVTTSASNTISVFAKADGKDILFISEGSLADVSFDLSSGLVIFERSGWVGSIEDFGDGWYRCIAVKSSSVSFAAYGVADIGGSNSVTASGTDGLLVWGMQCEVGSYLTSYIPTSGVAVTRVADSAEKSGISSLINSEEGVLYAEIAALSTLTPTGKLSLYGGSSANRVQIWYNFGVGTMRVLISSSSGLNYAYAFTPADITASNKIAVLWKNGLQQVYFNGVLLNQATQAFTIASGVLNELSFDENGSSKMYCKAQSVMVFPTALSDAELIALTTI